MNKAFTKEDDDAPEPILARPLSTLPPGVKNYMTEAGARVLRAGLERLRDVERPALAAQAPTDERAKRALQELDQRIAQLQHSLGTAELVPPPEGEQTVVRFGCTVTVRDSRGNTQRHRIVGVDEVDATRGDVSWRSPIGAALLKARVGQRVRVQLPDGDEELVVVGIE